MKLLPPEKRNATCCKCGSSPVKYEVDGKFYCNKCVLFASDQDKLRLLSRLKSDCEYYLQFNCGQNKHLWAGDPSSQIFKMRELYNLLSEKPEWLTESDISYYEKRMSDPKIKDRDKLHIQLEESFYDHQNLIRKMIQHMNAHCEYDSELDSIMKQVQESANKVGSLIKYETNYFD